MIESYSTCKVSESLDSSVDMLMKVFLFMIMAYSNADLKTTYAISQLTSSSIANASPS